MENIKIIINYKYLKDLILVIIIDYNCQKIIIIIRYNRLFTPKLGCGNAQPVNCICSSGFAFLVFLNLDERNTHFWHCGISLLPICLHSPT